MTEQKNNQSQGSPLKPPGGRFTPSAVLIVALVIAAAIIYLNRSDFYSQPENVSAQVLPQNR